MGNPRFPLVPVDVDGQSLTLGDQVVVLSVASCAAGLPIEDQIRLEGIVGQLRRAVRFDKFGFVWLSFLAHETSDDFCLFPHEVRVA
jgi:hypothetical protein